MEHESEGVTNCNWCSWYRHQRISKRIGELENKRKSEDHPNNSIIEIGQNTEKCPGDVRRLAVPQTPVRNHWLTLVWKTWKGVNNNNNRRKNLITKCTWMASNYLQKMKKKTGNSDTRSLNMQSGLRNGIWHRKMCNVCNEKWQTTSNWLPNQDKSRTLAENETYKYLGILEAGTIKQFEMKDKILKEYLRRTRKLLETKLFSRNLIKGINTWAVTLVRYSGPFLKWIRDKLKQMDQRTRKLMTMHKALHPRDNVDRVYVSRKEGGRGLASIKDSVGASIQRLEDYIQKHGGGLITAIRNENNTMDNRMTIARKQKWEGKQLYGRFKRLINNIAHDKTWTWLRKGNFKRQTEYLLIAAQKQRHKNQSYQSENI